MIYRHSEQQIQEYYERIGINQSSLKVIITKGIQSFIGQEIVDNDDLYYEEETHFIVGSAVDCRITQGEEIFNSKYHSSRLAKKPGDKAMSVIKLAFDKARLEFPEGPDVSMSLYKKQIFEACNEQGYYLNRKDKEDNCEADTRVEKLIKENGQTYWADLYSAEGKQILSEGETFIIDAIYMSLTTHKHTASLFKDSANVDIVYQLPCYWSYKDVDCKALLDMVIVNHTQKRIMPTDLKTFRNYILKFFVELKRRRYDLQGSYYSFALANTKAALSQLIGKDVSGYQIANFAFITESTLRPGTPLIYVLNDELMIQGRNGDTEENIMGWEQGIDIYKAWNAVDFSIERKLEKSSGVILLNKNFEPNLI